MTRSLNDKKVAMDQEEFLTYTRMHVGKGCEDWRKDNTRWKWNDGKYYMYQLPDNLSFGMVIIQVTDLRVFSLKPGSLYIIDSMPNTFGVYDINGFTATTPEGCIRIYS